MPTTYTMHYIAAGSITLTGGEYNPSSISIADATFQTIDITDNDGDNQIDGDNTDTFNDVGEDSDQVVAGTTDPIYIERQYILQEPGFGGESFTVYSLEIDGVFQGFLLPQGSPELPSNVTFNVTSSLNVTDDDEDASSTGAVLPPPYYTLDAPCFARGTMIETDRGAVAIEDIEIGDMVRTLDNGVVPVRWIGSSHVGGTGAMTPVVFAVGAIGNTRELVVSPKHRMLLQGWQLELLFDEHEALVTADQLVNDTTILRRETPNVEYFHVMFDSHQIIYAEGAPSESFYPAAEGIDKLAHATREEILTLFPQLRDDMVSYGPAVRHTLQASEVALMTDLN